jgi:DNA-binding transcriptional ArsR family regulator
MVNYLSADLDVTFQALADPTRRAILARLALGETSVSELAAPHKMSLPAVSKHVGVLERAGLLTRTKRGRVHRCQIVAEPMKKAALWIEHYRLFWETQLDSLEKYLGEAGATLPTRSPAPPKQSKTNDQRTR